MKMLHVTIQTSKFEDELNFYTDNVGLKIIRDMRPLGQEMIFLADEEGDTEIEIIGKPDVVDSGNENLSIGFRTDDVETKHKELSDKGIAVSPMINPVPQVKFFFVKDPAGVNVQFM